MSDMIATLRTLHADSQYMRISAVLEALVAFLEAATDQDPGILERPTVRGPLAVLVARMRDLRNAEAAIQETINALEAEVAIRRR